MLVASGIHADSSPGIHINQNHTKAAVSLVVSVYAGTEAECEEKLAGLIREMKTETAEARRLVSEGNWEEAMAMTRQKKAWEQERQCEKWKNVPRCNQ